MGIEEFANDMNSLYRTKKELRIALAEDIRDRKKMKADGLNTDMITKAIQNKRRILKSKSYWKK